MDACCLTLTIAIGAKAIGYINNADQTTKVALWPGTFREPARCSC